jgi:two-component system response regulator DesR
MPGCGVLALTSVRPAGPVRRLLASTVQGVLGKDTEPFQVAQAIRKVARGDRVIDPALAVAAMLVSQGPLTPRELDVLRVAAEGVPTAEIASRLHLSCGTVRNYVSSALRKTGARNRLEAARIADDAGWL